MSVPMFIHIYSNGDIWVGNEAIVDPKVKGTATGTLVTCLRVNSDAALQKVATLTGSGNASVQVHAKRTVLTMEEAEIKAPLYYVMGRKCEVDKVAILLTTTPCLTGVACTFEDKTLIESLVFEVLQANDATACNEMAAHVARTTGRPVLTVGAGKELKAVYSNDEEETLCLSNLTATN